MVAKKKITLNVPADLLDRLKELDIKNPIAFLEDLFEEVDVSDLVSMLEEDGYWYDDEDDEDDEESLY